MNPVAVAAVAVAVAGLAAVVDTIARLLRQLRAQRMLWWEATVTGSPVNLEHVELAVATTRRNSDTRTPVVAFARVGCEDTQSRLLFGFRRSQSAVRDAQSLAKVLGLELGEQVSPRWVPPTGGWWQAARPPDKDNDEEPLTVLTPVTQRHDQPEGQSTAFADSVEQHLTGPLDALVVCWRAGSQPEQVGAAAWATSKSLAALWLGHAGTGSQGMQLSQPAVQAVGLVSRLVAAAGGVAAAVQVVLFGAGFSDAGTLFAILLAVVSTGWSVTGVLGQIKNPPAVRHLRGGRVMLPCSKHGHMRAWKVAEWVSGGSTAALTATRRAAPDVMTTPAGVPIGVDAAGRRCWLADRDRQWGVILFGDPGTGKTTAALNLLAGDCQAIAAGQQRTVIWIETKGEGAERASTVVEANGVTPVVLNIAVADGLWLELVDRSDPTRAGQLLSEAMRYAFEPGDIQAHSQSVLTAAFRAAASVSNVAAAELGFPAPLNLVEAALVLLGTDAEARRALGRAASPEHRAALAQYVGANLTAYERRRQVDAPTNKLNALLPARGLFDGANRYWATFDYLLAEPRAVVVNVNPPSGATSTGYTDQTAQRVAAMVMYVLWDAIQRCCDSWQQQDRSVAIYSDELRDIAGFGGDGLDVVRAIADQGRSRGVMPVFATQRPRQLIPGTREAVMSFGTRGYFRLESQDEAGAAADDLDSAYTAGEIRSLPVGSCVLRTRRDGQAQPAFTLQPEHL